MVFVNEIADIVHGYTHRYLGSPNKNIGDAFLVVWKFNAEDVETDNSGDIKVKHTDAASRMADMAAVSFILTIAAINKSKKVAKYRSNAALNERMPNYRVRMGFGIHAGWAIEGAIGSEYKIDASYISPHVILTMALEEATKVYGVPFVISEHYFNLISKELQDNMRPLDRVEIHGFADIITIYTFDMDLNLLEVNKEDENEEDKEVQIMQRIQARKRRDFIAKATVTGRYKIKNKLNTDKDIIKIHKAYNEVNTLNNNK
jgi:class 3 adenylate cyclase